MEFKSINPYSDKVIDTHKGMSDKDIEKSIEKSYRAYKSWKRKGIEERVKLLTSLSENLKENVDNYAQIITQEMGKVLTESRAEVNKCASLCDYYASYAEEHLADEGVSTEASYSAVQYQPLGIILGVMPWNYPFWQVMRFAIPALAAGNSVLIKHASNVFSCAKAIESLFVLSDAPEGLFQSLTIDGKTVEKVIASPMVEAVSFTGSTQVGSKIATLAGKYIKKSVLELGGSDPFIVLSDADIEKAVEVGVRARMQNAGQSCIAAKRFIIMADVADDFMDAARAKVASLKIGNPMEEGVQMGPMARQDLVYSLNEQLSESLMKGAGLIAGGKIEGNIFHPTLLKSITPEMPVFYEETFGPMMSVCTVESEKEAIDFANMSDFGLGASIWTSDLDKAKALSRKIEAGNVFVNAKVTSHPKLPFGGVKSSGYGRELSSFGIKEFTNIQSLWID